MWKKSFQRIGLQRRATTTSKIEMSESTKKEAGLQNHYHITSIVEKHKIPVFGEQTGLKYVQVGCFNMATQGTKKVGITGIADKRMISLTLTATMDTKPLPFKAIYKEKTK